MGIYVRFLTGEAQRTKSCDGGGTTITSSRVTAQDREGSDATTGGEEETKWV